jgi:hypothetical protein
MLVQQAQNLARTFGLIRQRLIEGFEPAQRLGVREHAALEQSTQVILRRGVRLVEQFAARKLLEHLLLKTRLHANLPPDYFVNNDEVM